MNRRFKRAKKKYPVGGSAALALWTRPLRQALVVGGVSIILTLIVLFGHLFERARSWLTDLLYTSGPTSGKVVIVAIDDLSLGAYGRSVADWPRTTHVDLINNLSKAGARVLAFDVLFLESTSADDLLAHAIQSAQEQGMRTVLALTGDVSTERTPGNLLTYSRVLHPTESLTPATDYLAHVNVFPSADGTVRQIPLALRDGEHIWLSLSAAAYMAYLRIPPSLFEQVVYISRNRIALTPQRSIPVDDFGQMTPNFFGGANSFPIYSYRDVREGLINPEVFKDKIVLVGMANAVGATDRYVVPISRGNDLMSGIEIHANILETLLQNKSLTTQNLGSQIAVVVILALAASMAFSRLRWHWMLIAYLLLCLAVFLLASLAFSLWQQIIDLFYPAMALTTVTVGMLIVNLIAETRYRHQVQQLLDSANRLVNQRLLINDVLRQVAIEIERLLGYPNCAVWLWNEETLRLESIFWRVPPPISVQDQLNNIVTQAFETKEQIITDGVTGSIAVTPLFFQEHPLGVLAAVTSHRQRFSQEQVALFTIFSEQVAPALGNSQLYTQQQRQKDLLEAILTSTPDPVLVLDSQKHLLRMNSEATALFSIPGDLAQCNETFDELLQRVSVPESQIVELVKALTRTEAFQKEISIGSKKFILAAASLQLAYSGWVLVFNDVSTLKELDALKTQMLRMASHDLKNPLSVVLGYSQLMMEMHPSKEQHDLLQLIHGSGKKMLALITDLLDFERIRSGQLELIPCNLQEIVENVITEYNIQALDKSQILMLTFAQSPIFVEADGRQLSEAISNLVGNAIKYTPANGIIRVEVKYNEAKVLISIIDSGYGIPKDAQQKLFQPFYRAKTRATKDIPGTGLGLSLVKAVIEAHKGRIWLESEEGKGSVFFVELNTIPNPTPVETPSIPATS